jgi:hypothetical protein
MAVDLRASWRVVDDWGIEASTFVYGIATDAATAAEISADLQAVTLDLDKVVGGQITEMRATLFPALPPGNSTSTSTQIKNAASANDPVEKNGLLAFTATGTIKNWSFNLPSLSNSTTVVNNGKIVLTATSPAQVLADALTTGGTVVSYANEKQQALAALAYTRIGYHKHRKQLQRASTT